MRLKIFYSVESLQRKNSSASVQVVAGAIDAFIAHERARFDEGAALYECWSLL
jgi:hypothetical protein